MMKIKDIIRKYKLPVFLIVAILLAGILVGTSVRMYYVSGAAQLDLSRPEYVSVRSQIDKNATKKTSDLFDTQGEVTDTVLEEFLVDYRIQSSKALDSGAFSNEVLSDEALGISQ